MLSMLKRLPENAVYDTMKSPVGDLWIVATDKGLHAILWQKDMKESKAIFARLKKTTEHSILKKTKSQLNEYFAGKRQSFDLPLVMDGTTFQKKAWNQLTKIPFGKTISYQEQAMKLGDAKKCRAVGSANSRNPISIIVPCHRVIAKSGSLSGFGGGIHNKKYLIELENAQKN